MKNPLIHDVGDTAWDDIRKIACDNEDGNYKDKGFLYYRQAAKPADCSPITYKQLQKFEQQDSNSEISGSVLLAFSRAVESGKFQHYQRKKNQAEQALLACLRS